VTGEVPAHLRDRALSAARGLQEEVLQALMPDASGVAEAPLHSRSATEEELHAAVRRYDVTLASHTWSHANLIAIDPEGISPELERSHQWLAERFDAVVPWLAYPYGMVSAEVVRHARQGYDGALSLAGRIVPAPLRLEDRHRVTRVNIPAGISLEGFELRISGVFSRWRK
jgi:peptidoglycan/xylan/chitin deacetylase (PgdA/CDA1 family)